MGAAKEFLRLSQQNLAELDQGSPCEGAPVLAAREAAAAPQSQGKAAEPALSQSQQQPKGAPSSMSPNLSFLAILQGKAAPTGARQPSTDSLAAPEALAAPTGARQPSTDNLAAPEALAAPTGLAFGASDEMFQTVQSCNLTVA